MDMFDYAGLLFGGSRTAPDATTVTATGAGASTGGEVGITLDADVTPAEDTGVEGDEDQTIIDLPTSPDVDEGDELIVTLVGEGPLKTPVVTANPGSGDRMRALATSAKTVADAAQAVAEAVNQHFFADDGGIHVTEVTQEDWDENHSGANVLINSIGQLFRDGLNNLLTLTTEGNARALTVWDGLGNTSDHIRAIIGAVIQLGKAGESHAMLDYHSMQLIDKEGGTYFHVSDLRDESGYTYVTESFVADGTTSSYEVTLLSADGTNPTVTVDGVEVEVDLVEWPSDISFDAPAAGALVEITYLTNDRRAKAYTLGLRRSGSHLGPSSYAEGIDTVSSGIASHAEGAGTTAGQDYAHAEGNDTEASGSAAHAEGDSTHATGQCSHAEGTGTTASGADSHAEGWFTTASGWASHASGRGTVAANKAQTVVGKYNDNKPNNAFEIGNGTSDRARSNAFAVGWDGTVECAGDVTASGNVSGATVNGLPYPAPCGTFTGTNSTATASAAGWQLTYFNTVVAEVGSPRTYDYTFSNGVLTAKRDCVLEISGVMNWTDALAGSRGFGIFEGTTVGSGSEHSAFQSFAANLAGSRKSVVFPPKLFTLTAGSSLTFGRYQQQNAVYQDGTNYSWVTIKVVG